MKRVSILAAALCLTTSACVAPLVRPNAITFQSKMGYAADWRALADRTANRFAATLHDKPPNVYVAPGPADMKFAVAYRQYLEQALMKHGYPVVESAADAVVLNFEVQPYLYKDRDHKLPSDYASFYSAAYALSVPARDLVIDAATGIIGISGPVLDLLDQLYSGTNAEVTLTLSVTDRSRQHYIDSETFYVQPSDLARFYWTEIPASAPQTMPRYAGGLAEVALPVLNHR